MAAIFTSKSFFTKVKPRLSSKHDLVESKVSSTLQLFMFKLSWGQLDLVKFRLSQAPIKGLS